MTIILFKSSFHLEPKLKDQSRIWPWYSWKEGLLNKIDEDSTFFWDSKNQQARDATECLNNFKWCRPSFEVSFVRIVRYSRRFCFGVSQQWFRAKQGFFSFFHWINVTFTKHGLESFGPGGHSYAGKLIYFKINSNNDLHKIVILGNTR